MNSIRKKLLRWLLIGQLVAVGLTGTITFFYVRSELEDLFDDRLRQLAYSMPTEGQYNLATPPLTKLQDEDDDFVIQVWGKKGALLGHLNRKEGAPELAAEGFSTHLSKGMLWRSFVLRRGDQMVQTSQPFTDRLEMTTGVALGAIAPVLVLIVILGGVVWVSVGRGLFPLKKLTSDLGNRHSYSLEPLAADTLPDELQPLVQALNGLLVRLGDALESQRKFVADAAHALRTPLTAVQLQAQLLQRATTEEAREQAQAQILTGTARASHLVHQLLTLARMEPEDWQHPLEAVDLSKLLKSVAADHALAALNRQIDLGVSHDESLMTRGDIESLRVMLGNLVDNALRYTPKGGRVNLALRKAGDFAQLEVTDTGRGIPVSDREQVFTRFYRRPGTSEMGSGLGLAIVQGVVARHHGKVRMEDGENGTGLKLIVNLPIFKDGVREQGLNSNECS